MKKRILAFALTLCLLSSVMSPAVFATGASLSFSECDNCHQTVCQCCTVCGAYPCEATHVQCGICGGYDCVKEHVKCGVCSNYDCTVQHVYCDTCAKYDCGTDHSVGGADTDVCSICGESPCACKSADDGIQTDAPTCPGDDTCTIEGCTNTHTSSGGGVTATSSVCALCAQSGSHGEWCPIYLGVSIPTTGDYSGDVGKIAKFDMDSVSFLVHDAPEQFVHYPYADDLANNDWGNDAYWITEPESDDPDYATKQAEYDALGTLEMKVVSYYWNADTTALWYKVEAAEGHTLPALMTDNGYYWVFQNFTSEYKFTDEYRIYWDQLVLSSIDDGGREENPCGCCDSCTGDETCTCECEGCTCKPAEENPCGCCDSCTGDETCTCECEGCTCKPAEENPCGCCDSCTGDEACTCECEGCTCKEDDTVCEICGNSGCTALHFWCDICKDYDCGEAHLYCKIHDKYDCTETHVWCGTCGTYNCGEVHEDIYTPATAPVIPANPILTGADVTIVDEYGDPVTEEGFPLFEGMKSSLSAWSTLGEGVTYQWQIRYDGADDLWADIKGQTSKGILVSPAMFVKFIAAQGDAVIRCVVTSGDATQISASIPVSITSPIAAYAAAPYGAAGNPVNAAAEPDAELSEKINLIINYQFFNGDIAANPWTAEIASGDAISQTVTVPTVAGYVPTFTNTPNVTLSGNTLSISYAKGALTETTNLYVVYQPTNVKVTVMHYWQNVDNDNYVLHETTETYELVTGETVGDVHKVYSGFYNLLYEKPVVAADGSTVVEVYYDRYYYLMKFDLDDGYGTDPIYARYGAALGTIADPENPGWTFGGWATSDDGTTAVDLPATMPAENRIYYAIWTDPQIVNYTVVYWRENANDTNYSLWGSATKTALTGSTVSGSDSVSADLPSVTDEQYFTYNGVITDKDVVVKGNGSTIVNVYYLRNYYTVFFYGLSRGGDGLIAGACAATEHEHGDGKCNTPLICNKADHVHDESCNPKLICTIGEHAAHTADCLVCTIPEHTHGEECCDLVEHTHTDDCYTCTEHTAHTRNCYDDVGDRYNNNTNGWETGEGLIHRRQNGNKYIYINGSWYRYTGDSSDGTTVSPTCDGLHTHGDGNCTYKDTEHIHGGEDCECNQTAHTHGAACYNDTLHTHGELCYEYNCGSEGHVHTPECYRDCILPEHTHGTTCSSSTSTRNIIYVITAKYEQDISSVWPTVDVFPTLRGWSINGSSTTQTSKVLTMTYNLCDTNDGVTPCYAVTSKECFDHLYYMFESFDQTSEADGTTRIQYDGVYYDKDVSYSQDVNSGGGDWNAKDITGLTSVEVVEEVLEGSDDDPEERNIFLYYKRNRHTIHFVNTNTGSDDNATVKSVANVMYGQPLANYKASDGVLLSDTTAPYPGGLEDDVYEFAGWYTTPEGYEGTQFNFATATLPDSDLYLYAKWVPITHTVRFFIDKDDYEADLTIPESLNKEPYNVEFVNRTVSHNSYLTGVDTPEVAEGDENFHPYSQYDFEGWYYMEGGEEKRFVVGDQGMPVTSDLDLYAKWGSNVLRGYTVYFALDADGDGVADKDADGNIIYVAKPASGSGLAGNSKTIDAKGDTALFAAYQTGYYPNVASHTITLSIEDADNEGENTFTFLYKPSDPVPYTVKYLIAGTDAPVPGTSEKHVDDNNKAVVTENFVPASGYMPDKYQKTLVVVPGGENVIIFWYTRDEIHALYQVNHYVQNLDGETWTLYSSNTITGEIDSPCSESAKTDITGFVFSDSYTGLYNAEYTLNGTTHRYGINAFTGEALPGAVSFNAGTDTVSGTLTDQGMQLNLYYVRSYYPYEVHYVEAVSGAQLHAPTTGYAAYGQLVNERYIPIGNPELYDVDAVSKNCTIVAEDTVYTEAQVTEEGFTVPVGTAQKNIITFYYSRKTGDLEVVKAVEDKSADRSINTALEYTFEVTSSPYPFISTAYAYTKYQKSVDSATGAVSWTESGTGYVSVPTSDDGQVGNNFTFTLKGNEKIVIHGLPTGFYTIREINLPVGYYLSSPAYGTSLELVEVTDAQSGEKVTFATTTFTNTYEPANLTVTKTVNVVEEDGNTPEVEDFQFTITFPAGVTPQASYDYTVSGVDGTQTATVSDGKMVIFLKNGQTATFTNLPLGTYTVEEKDYSAQGYDSNYKVNAAAEFTEGEVAQVVMARNATQAVEFMNKFPVGDLIIEKKLSKEYYDDAWTGDTFTFTVKRTSKDLIVGNTYKLELDGTALVARATVLDDKTIQVAITFGAEDAAALKTAGASVTHTLVIKNLPAGTYDVTEEADSAYVQTPAGLTVSGLAIPSEETKAAFTNTYKRTTGNLHVGKEIVIVSEGAEIDEDQQFTFEVMLKEGEGVLTGPYACKIMSRNGTKTDTSDDTVVAGSATSLSVSGGKLTFKLKHDQYILIEKLPVGKYLVRELAIEGYDSSFGNVIEGNQYSVDPATITTNATTVLNCQNAYPVYYTNLTVQKTVVTPDGHSAIDQAPADDEFTFTVTISDYSSRADLTNGVAAKFYDSPDDTTATEKALPVTAGGVLTFTLKHGQWVELNLPVCMYTIAETGMTSSVNTGAVDAHYDVAYTVNGTTGVAGSKYGLASGDKVTVVFTNTYKRHYANLTITKTGLESIDENQSTIYTVKGLDANNSHIDMQVAIIGNSSVTIKDLPVGKYSVTEEDDWSWRYTSSGGGEVNITENAAVDFTNTRNKFNWLGGDNFAINIFDGNNSGVFGVDVSWKKKDD